MAGLEPLNNFCSNESIAPGSLALLMLQICNLAQEKYRGREVQNHACDPERWQQYFGKFVSKATAVSILSNLQSGRQISAIIDDYLCYMELKKSLQRISYFSYLTNYLSLKLRTYVNVERLGVLIWTVRTSTFNLRSHRDLITFFTAFPRVSDQKISMKCYFILCKLH